MATKIDVNDSVFLFISPKRTNNDIKYEHEEKYSSTKRATKKEKIDMD